MPNNNQVDFCIEIDYKKDSENPARVFEAMSGLIKAFQAFDSDLIKSIDNKIEPILLLEDIEIGSIKAWLANGLRGIPDDAIKDLDWKKIVGNYLIKAKYILINKLSGKTLLTDASEIEDIQYELLEEAKKTNLKQFPSYTSIKMQTLVHNISNINSALKPLSKEDTASFKTGFGDASFNLELDISPESLEELVTKEKIASEVVMILKVKQPDYLGNAQWTFKYNGRLVYAKIINDEWLKKFQEREIDIRPGDSLRAKVTTTVNYGHDYEVIGHHYEMK
ncbi:MAG: hypothetical protein IM572_06270 [Chitinophagaceae bacterium]|nr:hypothetical protein [Microcystis sp. M065S1]MCA6492263.1 hypothetical protein [Chitinophagaceae bacterium]